MTCDEHDTATQQEWTWEDVESVLNDLKADGYEVADFETSTSDAAPKKAMFLEVQRDDE